MTGVKQSTLLMMHNYVGVCVRWKTISQCQECWLLDLWPSVVFVKSKQTPLFQSFMRDYTLVPPNSKWYRFHTALRPMQMRYFSFNILIYLVENLNVYRRLLTVAAEKTICHCERALPSILLIAEHTCKCSDKHRCTHTLHSNYLSLSEF